MIINNVANYLNFFRIAMPRFLGGFRIEGMNNGNLSNFKRDKFNYVIKLYLRKCIGY